MMNKISVGEALKKIDKGLSLSEYAIDFEHVKVEALDVMKLAKNGVQVPEEVIYYDDEAIQHDEAFDGEWQHINYDPVAQVSEATEVKITLKKEVKNWVESQNIQLEQLIENLLDNFYQTQQLITKE